MLEGGCFFLDKRQIATGYKQGFYYYYYYHLNPLGPKFGRGKIDVHAKCFLDGSRLCFLAESPKAVRRGLRLCARCRV